MEIAVRKFIAFMIFGLYDYYKQGKGTSSTAYERAISVLLAVIFFNMITLLSLLNLDNVIPVISSDPRWLQYLKIAAIYVVPGYLIISLLFKKVDIVSLKYDELVVRRGRILFFIYFGLSFISFIVIAIIKH